MRVGVVSTTLALVDASASDMSSSPAICTSQHYDSYLGMHRQPNCKVGSWQPRSTMLDLLNIAMYTKARRGDEAPAKQNPAAVGSIFVQC